MNPLDIPGWMLPEELNWLYKTAKNRDTILEIGTWKGRSTSALCNGCSNLVISVDNYSGSVIDKENFTELAAGKDIELVARNNLREYLDSSKLVMLKEFHNPLNIKFNMLFIDGDHETSHVLYDILYYMQFLKSKGSIISGHDIHLSSVQEAVRDVFGNDWKVVVPGTTIWYKEF